MPFIIDGNNLLRSVQKVREDPAALSAERLCRIISRYLRAVGEKGEIVFDGTGPRDKGGFDNISDLEVSFAGLKTDADSIIEDRITVNTAPKRLTVVSTDRRLRDAARARRSIVVKSQDFWYNVQKQLSRRTGTKEPPEKRRGLTEGETERWLRLFGLGQ